MRAQSLLTASLFLCCACGVEDIDADSGVVSSSAGYFEATPHFVPTPPAVGKNSLELELRDRDGNRVSDAALIAEPWMPAHSHGSAIQPSVRTTVDGAYVVEELRFTMPGTWEVRIQIESNDLHDSLVVSADVH